MCVENRPLLRVGPFIIARHNERARARARAQAKAVPAQSAPRTGSRLSDDIGKNVQLVG
jgi:hypothetical protein